MHRISISFQVIRFIVVVLYVLSPCFITDSSNAQSCSGGWLYHAQDQVRPGIDLFNNRTSQCVVGWDPDGPGPEGEWVVVGGFIDRAGNTPVTNIAAYDGTQWRALGAGLNNTVNALVVLNGELYAAGSFTASGATPINHVARWNGTAWQPLGSGPGSAVAAMQSWNNQIVVNRNVNGLTLDVRVWNGSAWSTLGSGSGSPTAFSTLNGQLVAATSAGAPNYRVIVWNGSTWSNLGTTFNGSVNNLIEFGGNIFAAGSFTSASGIPANNIARWDGSTWSSLGTGVNSGISGLAVLGSEIFVCGTNLTNAGGVAVSNVARWNGTNWLAASSGIANTGSVNDLASVHGRIYAVGSFMHSVSQVTMYGIAEWNAESQRWEAVSSSFDLFVRGFLEYQGALIAYGDFTHAGGNSTGCIAKWDGLTWEAIGTVPLSGCSSIVEYNGELLAAGVVINPNLTTTNRVVRFNGTTWIPMLDDASSTFDGQVSAMIVYQGQLHAAGRFTTAGGVAANRIARWNGSSWVPLESGLVGTVGNNTARVNALAIFNNELYVGGAFANAGTQTNVNFIARWNGTTWNRAGTINAWTPFGAVSALAVFNGNLYATGGAIFNSGVEMGRWNGVTWTEISPGLQGGDATGTVGGRSLCVHNGKLYVGGTFTSVATGISYRIARWTGSAWQVVGTDGLGFNAGNLDLVLALASYKNEVLVGGRFPAIGAASGTSGTGSGNFARFTETNIPWIAEQPQQQDICVGQAASFESLPATGYTGLSYRWQFEPSFGSGVFVDIASNAAPGIGVVSGQTTTALSVESVSSNSGSRIYKVRMIASNACGEAISNTANLNIDDAPTIAQQPESVLACSGSPDESAAISVGVGPTLVSYNLTWQIEDAGVPSGWRDLIDTLGYEPLVLASTQTCGQYRYTPNGLVFVNLCPQAHGSRFRARASNSCGVAISQPAELNIVGAPLLPCDGIDFNNDCSAFDPIDIDAFLSVYGEGPCIPDTATCNDIDFNNDGSLFDPCDIDSFLVVFSEGPCTPCGQ